MIRLWGRKNSINVQKVLWCLAELDLVEGSDFERVDAGLQFGKNNTSEYLKLNPNGFVPVLEDGEIILWESNTIMRYLIRQHDQARRFSTNPAIQYRSEAWLDWQLGTMWPPLRSVFLGFTRTPENERNYVAMKQAYQDTNHRMAILDQVLANQAYCAGNAFHLGDIALALCVQRWILLNQAFPEKTGARTHLINLENWLQRIQAETKFNMVADKAIPINN